VVADCRIEGIASPCGAVPLSSAQTEQGHGDRDKTPDSDESMNG